MKVMIYQCDLCEVVIPEADLVKVEITHAHGKFDLRDDELEICPSCEILLANWLTEKAVHNPEKRP